jgi:hypothetical protein
MRIIVIGRPIPYLAGAVGSGIMDLKIGGENVIDGIVFGSHWPNYVRFIVS